MHIIANVLETAYLFTIYTVTTGKLGQTQNVQMVPPPLPIKNVF